MEEFAKRKPNRLHNFDYSTNGAYFVTICARNMKYVFGTIVGCGVLDAPYMQYSEYGEIVKNQIIEMNGIYKNINVNKFVVMPNHLHLIIEINNVGGASRTPHPTNSLISSFVGTLKRFTNKKIGKNIWQTSFYDHIIRDEDDYIIKARYIENNPAKWTEDKYYIK